MFEIAAQEMGKFVGGHKKIKTFAQEWEQNNECKPKSFSVRGFYKFFIMSSFTQEVFPSTSLYESRFVFNFETDRNLYFNMLETHHYIKLQLFKAKNEKAE